MTDCFVNKEYCFILISFIIQINNHTFFQINVVNKLLNNTKFLYNNKIFKPMQIRTTILAITNNNNNKINNQNNDHDKINY